MASAHRTDIIKQFFGESILLAFIALVFSLIIVKLLLPVFNNLAANIIAWPIAYYAVNKWLQGFAYRTTIGLWIFILAAAMVLFIALLTVSYQSFKAAMANPVDALKYE